VIDPPLLQFPPGALFATIVLPIERSPGWKMPPPRFAPFDATVTLLSVAVTVLSSPPPSVTAVFPLSVTFVNVSVPSFWMPPPAAADVLPLTVTRWSRATPVLYRPPPRLFVVLPLSVTSFAVRSLSLRIPPPPSRPSLVWTRTWFSVSTAEFQMPPASTPRPEKPLRTVRPWIVTLPAVSKMSNTRSMRPASMIVDVAPAPLIVTGRVMSRSPVAARFSPLPATVSVNVPAGTVMVSAPDSALAALIASRSVQPPAVVAHTPSVPSAVVLTTKVAARDGDAPTTTPPIARTARTEALRSTRTLAASMTEAYRPNRTR
jgi:hypothetical protein